MVTGCELLKCQFKAARDASGMFDEIDVDSGTKEGPSAENSEGKPHDRTLSQNSRQLCLPVMMSDNARRERFAGDKREVRPRAGFREQGCNATQDHAVITGFTV